MTTSPIIPTLNIAELRRNMENISQMEFLCSDFSIFNLKRIRSKDLAIWNHGSCVTGVIGSQREEGCREGDVIEMLTH